MINWKRSGRRSSRPDAALVAGHVRGPAGRRDAVLQRASTSRRRRRSEQLAIMELADARDRALAAQVRDDAGAQFVRTAAATAIGFWAIDVVRPGSFGNYGFAAQHRHDRRLRPRVGRRQGPRDAAATCRASSSSTCSPTTSIPTACGGSTNPAIHAFFAAVWPQSSSAPAAARRPADGSIRGGGAGEVDPIQNLSRYHYLKEIFLDSATTARCCRCVPTSPDTDNPLPIAEAARDDRHRQRPRATSQRAVHARVRDAQPRLGGGNSTPGRQAAVPRRGARADDGAGARSTATSCAAGRPTAPGATCRTPAAGSSTPTRHGVPRAGAARCSEAVPEVPPVVATHKGFALPGFDQRAAAPRDVGPAAKAVPGRQHHRLPLGLRHRRHAGALPRRRRGRLDDRTRSTG